MQYKIEKRDGYRVSGPSGVHAKSTSKRKAKAQVMLLRGVERGWKPTGKKKRGSYLH